MNISCFTVGAYSTNCYCVCGDTFAFIVDPAYPSEEILSFAKQNSNKPIKYILLTHCHIDHIEGVNKVKEIWKCPVVISQKDAVGLENPKINLSQMLFEYNFSITADYTVKNGDEIDMGELKVSVIETPGHTVGSVCYICGDNMFSGDTLFYRTIGRTDVPTSDFSAMQVSLKKLSDLNTDYKIFAGHGKATNLFDEKKYNGFMSCSL